MTENPRLLFPGAAVPQLDKVAISKVGRQKGLVVKQNAAVREAYGFDRSSLQR